MKTNKYGTILLFFICFSNVNAQIKIFIETDLEGVSGVYKFAQTREKDILVTGDAATCREAVKFFGNNLVTVATKEGISREAAVLYPFEETHKALYEGEKKAIAAIPKCKPYIVETPIKAKMQYLDPDPKLPEPKLITREWTIPDALHLLGN